MEIMNVLFYLIATAINIFVVILAIIDSQFSEYQANVLLVFIGLYFICMTIFNLFASTSEAVGEGVKSFIANTWFQIAIIAAGALFAKFIGEFHAGLYFGTGIKFIDGVKYLFRALQIVLLFVEFLLYQKSQGSFSKGWVVILAFGFAFVASLITAVMWQMSKTYPYKFFYCWGNALSEAWMAYFAGVGVYALMFIIFPFRAVKDSNSSTSDGGYTQNA